MVVHPCTGVQGFVLNYSVELDFYDNHHSRLRTKKCVLDSTEWQRRILAQESL